MGTILLEEKFTIDDIAANVTSVKLSNEAGTAGIIRDDTGAVVVADGTDMVNIETGLYQYEFTESVIGLTYTYYIEWVYGGETYRDTKTFKATTPTDFSSSAQAMNKAAMVSWLKAEFQPLTFATPDTTLEQIVDNAVRYWNTHSAYEVYEMAVPPTSGGAVQLSPQIKMVASVYPSKTSTWIFNNHPLWTMTSIQVLDNVTGDLIMMSEAFRNYHIYIGSDMRWHYVKSDDPTKGGMLFMENIPRGSEYICVRGSKRILADEIVTSQYILDWVLSYAKALFKQIEGNTLRKAMVADIPNDGGDQIREGKEEQKDLIEQLKRDGRWLAFARRS